MFEKGCLHGMQRSVGFCHALDGGHALAYTGRKRETRQNAFVTEQNGTGATLAMIAALLRACQAKLLAEQVEQRRARIKRDVMRRLVNRQRGADQVAKLAHRWSDLLGITAARQQ